jgi:hypothetical protein
VRRPVGHVASDGHHVTAGCRGRAGPAAVASRPQGRVGAAVTVKQGTSMWGSTGDSASAGISGVMGTGRRAQHNGRLGFWQHIRCDAGLQVSPSHGMAPDQRGLGVGGIQAQAILWRACWGLLSVGHGMAWPSQAETDSRPYYGPINVSPHHQHDLQLEVVAEKR